MQICEYILAFISYRQKEIKKKSNLLNRIALIEEYREWITDGINNNNVIYIISQNEIQDRY
tara:strand:+ start:188 stop:370 length:183 start_codon:yes stop_codon:yes gene_type:complete